MPLNPIRNSECKISAYMPQNRVMMINSKLASLAKWLSVRLRTKWFWVRVQLQSLHKLKSNGGNSSIINYYIQELNRMKNDAYKYPIYSHLGVYIPENWF